MLTLSVGSWGRTQTQIFFQGVTSCCFEDDSIAMISYGSPLMLVNSWYQAIVIASVKAERLSYLCLTPSRHYTRFNHEYIYILSQKFKKISLSGSKLAEWIWVNLWIEILQAQFHTWRLPLHSWGSRGCKPQTKQYFGVTSGNCVMKSVRKFLNKTRRGQLVKRTPQKCTASRSVVFCLLSLIQALIWIQMVTDQFHL